MHDRFVGQSSFATYAIAHERNTVKFHDDAPLELLGPLGCGIQTGAGTVLRALEVGAGATFAAPNRVAHSKNEPRIAGLS